MARGFHYSYFAPDVITICINNSKVAEACKGTWKLKMRTKLQPGSEQNSWKTKA